ncbi:site-specific integrase [Streptomyces erythrochromogenes]|uniref:site-specific integrase n=1 Tax=Streptomyces erythrochromogenes TaxID=285574 RepID=UPI0038185F48
MTTPTRPTSQPAATAASPFAGADLCRLAGFTLPTGAPRSVFEDDIWDFTQVIGMPAYLAKCARRLDFTRIANPRWKAVAKEYAAAQMAPGHEAVRLLPHANRNIKAIGTIYAELGELVRWLNWLTARGIRCLDEVTEHHCTSFAQYRATHRPNGTKTPHRESVHKLVASVILGLVQYGELFTTDRYREGLRPFAGHTAGEVAGTDSGPAENKTQPVAGEVFQPLLASALYLVNTLAPHLVHELETKRHEDAVREALRASALTDTAVLEGVLHRHVADARPFHLLPTWSKIRNWGLGEEDPLARVNLRAIAHEAGKANFGPRLLLQMRPAIEKAVAAVGVDEPWCRDAALMARADGQGSVPWSLPLAERDLRTLTQVVKTAAHLLIVALSGMRQSELREMNVGCRVPPVEAGPGLVRYKLASRVVKDKPLGGVADEWVVVKEAYDAAEVAEQLLGAGADIGDPLVTGPLDRTRFTTFRNWVNGPAGRRLGLAPIPGGPLSARMLRRTLALEIAYRPGGLLAAKVQLKHLSVVTTEGYAARPGGAQAKFLAEVNAEENERNKDLVLTEFRRYQQGHLPAGPGARDLIDFFAGVDGRLARTGGEDSVVVDSDQQVRDLLASRAEVLHLGVANYCWFTDPSKALCLKLAGTPEATKPLVGMCDSSRCPQATHHPCHRPVWATSAQTKQAFIGSIARRQKSERARLQTDLDRDLAVLTAIDATT